MIPSVVSPALLRVVPQAYGRYSNSSWGPLVPNRLSWVVQELPVCAWGFWALMRTDFDPLQKKTATVVVCACGDVSSFEAFVRVLC